MPRVGFYLSTPFSGLFRRSVRFRCFWIHLVDIDKLREMCSEDVLELNREIFDLTEKPKIGHKNKYNARRTEVDGIIFDSGAEARRYRELKMMEDAGLISRLQRQVSFTLQDAFIDNEGRRCREVRYTADFTYQVAYQDRWITVIEDVKSRATAKGEAFRIRWRLLQKQFESDSLVRCVLTS